MDEHMTVSMIIDDLYWNSFTERVPRTMRGTHFVADDSCISVTDNNGYHTLSLCVRMSICVKKDVTLTKKQLQIAYQACGASLFIDFKNKNQKLILDNCRDPTDVSFPMRIEDEHIIPARIIEDGEEVTDTGVILTPLVSTRTVSPTESAVFVDDVVPMVYNMDYLFGNKIPKAASDIKEAAEMVSRGIGMNEETKEVAGKVALTLEEMNQKLNKLESMKMSHEHKHSFDFKSIFTSTLDSCLEKFKGILPEDPGSRDLIIGLIIGLVYLWAVKNEHKKFMYVGLLLATTVAYWTENKYIAVYCASLFGVNGVIDIIPMIMELLTSEDEEEKEFVMGNNSETLDAIQNSYQPSTLMYAFIAMMFGVAFNITPNPHVIFSELTIFNKVFNGLELTYMALTDYFVTTINAMTGPVGVRIFRSCYTKYPEAFMIVDDLNVLKTRFLEGKRMTKVDYDKFKCLVKALDVLDKSIPLRPEYRVYKMQVDYARKLQFILEDKFKIMGVVVGGVRAASYTVTLVGGPGLGKSVITPMIANALAPIVLPADDYALYGDDPKSFVVTVNPSEEYQEAIKPGHVIYMVDDIFQMKNKNADPKICHANWLIGVNNNAEKCVNKAFGDKGTVFLSLNFFC
jgi:hypothetical protein